MNNKMRGTDSLTHVLAALGELGGYFVLRGEHGEEYVVIDRDEFEALRAQDAEVQMPLPPLSQAVAELEERLDDDEEDAAADETLARINREIATYQLQQESGVEAQLASEVEKQASEETDDLGLARGGVSASVRGTRVRFEALRGDLPPELQE